MYNLYMYKKIGTGICFSNAAIIYISITTTFCCETEIHSASTIQLEN